MSPLPQAAAHPDAKEIDVRKPSPAPRDSRPAFLGDLLDTLTSIK